MLRFEIVNLFYLGGKIIAYADFEAPLKNCSCCCRMVSNGKYEF